MPKIVFVDSSGQEQTVDARVGDSVMMSATQNGIEGIVGECGGNCSCATCHVWVREEFVDRVGPATDLEDDLLDMGVSERRSGSRLSCQITVTGDLDGLTLDVPPEQP